MLALFAGRDPSGATAITYGTLVDVLGEAHHLSPGAFHVEPLNHWASPRTGIRYPSGWRVRLPDERLDRFKEETLAFTTAVREGTPVPIPAEEVIWTNVIMDGIYRSAAEGREVPVGLPG